MAKIKHICESAEREGVFFFLFKNVQRATFWAFPLYHVNNLTYSDLKHEETSVKV